MRKRRQIRLAENFNFDEQLQLIIKNALKEINKESLQIKKSYFQEIQLSLSKISNIFLKTEHMKKFKNQFGKLENPYAPEFGFSQSTIAQAIIDDKNDQAIVYEELNHILSFLRQQQHMNYVLYIKNNENFYRYEVPADQVENFTIILQNNNFKNIFETGGNTTLRQFAETSLEKLENAKIISQHIDNFMKVIDSSNKLKGIKLADKYEGFEYHYQNVDINLNNENFSHSFNLEGIERWFLGRGHDTVGWWVRGDIGLTSVKSVNLNNKYLFLSLATQRSLTEVYNLLAEIFSTDTLSADSLNRLIRAFTPLVSDFKKGFNIDIEKTVKDLIDSLTK